MIVLVKFDKTVNTIAVTRKPSDGDDEQTQDMLHVDSSVKVLDSNMNKKVKSLVNNNRMSFEIIARSCLSSYMNRKVLQTIL
jgi:hypothetical protein